MASLSSYGGKLSNFGNTGGGTSVTTTYLDSLDATLAAGFTTSLNHTYYADRASLDNMWAQYWGAKDLALATVTFLKLNNATVVVTLANALIELKELEENFKNARIYDGYTVL